MTTPLILSINLAAFTAVSRFVSPHESRPILNGVYCDPAGILVATDGVRLLAWPHAISTKAGEAIPQGIILKPGKLPKVAKGGGIIVEYVPDKPHLTAHRYITGKGTETMLCAAIEGPPPNWRQVIPRTERLAPDKPLPHFDARRLADFALPWNGRSDKDMTAAPAQPRLTPQDNPRAAILVDYEGLPCIGALMPVAGISRASHVPEWIEAPYPTV